MTYITVARFADLKDNNHIYEAGEQYPRPGFEVSEARLAELAGSGNRLGYPLIAAQPEPAKPEKKTTRKKVAEDDRADLRTDQ